jgi:hypothetical protein
VIAAWVARELRNCTNATVAVPHGQRTLTRRFNGVWAYDDAHQA